MVHPDSRRISRVRRYLGYSYRIQNISLTGLSPSVGPLSSGLNYVRYGDVGVLQPRAAEADGLASSLFARHYWGNLVIDFFSTGTEIFHFSVFPLCAL